MAFVIEQPDGAGAGNPSLDHAWLDTPVELTGATHPDTPYEILDVTDLTSAELAEDDGGLWTLVATGEPGGVRVAANYADGSSVIRVIGFTRDDAGTALAIVCPPMRGEVPGERNGARGYCHSWDAEWKDTRDQIAAIKARLDALENP